MTDMLERAALGMLESDKLDGFKPDTLDDYKRAARAAMLAALDPEDEDLISDIACEIAPSGDEDAAVEIAFIVKQTIGNLRHFLQKANVND